MYAKAKPATARQTCLVRYRLRRAGLPIRKVQTQASEASLVTTIAAPRDANAAHYEDVLHGLPRLDKRVEPLRRITAEYTEKYLLLTVCSRLAGSAVPALKAIPGDDQHRIPLDLVQPGDVIQLPGVILDPWSVSRVVGWSPAGLVQNVSLVRGRWRVSWIHGPADLVEHAALPFGVRLLARTRYDAA